MNARCEGTSPYDALFPVRARLKYAASRVKRQFTSQANAEVAYQHHIYLHSWKLVYFFVPKVACTSIKSVLGDLLSFPSDRSPHDYPFPRLEQFAFDRAVADCHSFAVVREPISRLLSGYKSMVMRPVHDRHYFRGVFRPLVKYGGFQHGMSFEAFCRRIVEIPDRYCDPHIRSQSVCFTDAKFGCLAQRLIRFESLNEELPRFLQAITGHPIQLQKRNPTGGSTRIPELSQECRRMLERRFAADFELYEAVTHRECRVLRFSKRLAS